MPALCEGLAQTSGSPSATETTLIAAHENKVDIARNGPLATAATATCVREVSGEQLDAAPLK
jgi:hypothetical protein